MKAAIKFFILILVVPFTMLSQLTNPNTYIFPAPDPTPPNLAVDSYTRAQQSIKLLPGATLGQGFKYGFVTGNATNLLNLSIGTNPSYVSSAYLNSGLNPLKILCGSVPSVDLSKPVGETPGGFRVTSTGGASYNIPIVVSPGTKGVQPGLSASYNSQSGLGILGIGWNLNGLSSITRIGKTPMHDGVFWGVDLSTNDVFALDGNRLFALTGTYGQSGTTYYPEEENFASITSFGTVGNGPEKFLVKDKAGNTLQYGYSVDSRLTGIGANTSILSWYLNSITDEFGNYMTYTYKQLNGELVIDKIEYTGNSSAGLSPYNKVTFSYIPLAEQNSSYINGVEFRRSQLLKDISCWAGNTRLKKYVFDYEWKQGTYLSLVTEVDAGGNELNPTKFCWNDPNDDVGTKTPQNLNTNFINNDYIDLSTVSADFNGDGFSDFLAYNVDNQQRLRVYENQFIINYGTANNNISFNLKADIANHFAPGEYLLASNVSDANSDGKQEVYSCIATNTYAIGGGIIWSKDYYVIKTEYGNNANVLVTNLGSNSTNNGFIVNSGVSQFYFGNEDYTGDGYKDVLTTNNESIKLVDGFSNLAYVGSLVGGNSNFVRPFNFDGDGIMDFLSVTYYPNYLDISILKISGGSFVVAHNFQITSQSPVITNGVLILPPFTLVNITFGDINGDGLDDLIYVSQNHSILNVFYNKGNSFASAIQVPSFAPLGQVNSFDLHCADLNSDGKDDIIINESIAPNTSKYQSYLSFGNLILKAGSYVGNTKIGEATKVHYEPIKNWRGKKKGDKEITETFEFALGFNIIYGDYNGDGIADYTDFSGSSGQLIANNVNGEPRMVINQMYTPFKNNISIKYANIAMRFSSNNNLKEEVLKPISNAGFSNGIGKTLTNIYCVSHTTNTSGYSGQFQNSMRYLYANPVFHQFGKGFLGFESIESIDLSTMIGSQSSMSVIPGFVVPMSFEQTSCKYLSASVVGLNASQTFNQDLNKIISRNNNTVSCTSIHPNGCVIQPIATISTDYLSSTRQSVEYTYDMNSHGNIQTTTTKAGWNLASPVKSSISTITYLNNNGIFKPSHVNIATTQAGEGTYVRNLDYTYDVTGHVTSIVNDQNTPGLSGNVLTTAFSQFNAFGGAKKVTISAPDISQRVEEVVYDLTGRFVTKKTNAIGDFSEYVYEPVFGNLILAKDITGLIYTHNYDDSGKQIKTTKPNNAVSKVTYAWETPPNYPYSASPIGAYSVKNEADAVPYSKTYYAGNGMVLRNETVDHLGNLIINDTKYNSAGANSLPDGIVIESTEPHYVAQQKYLKTVYAYEPVFYRLTTNTTYSINGGIALNTGAFSQTNYNPPSNLNTFNASYTEILNQNSQSLKKFINSAGQETLVVNSNLSQTQNSAYTYFSNGYPKSITLSSPSNPGQNIVHSFIYNGLAQKVTMIDPSIGITTYQYNTLGELLQQSSASGVYSFTYDLLGRIISKTGNLTGATTYQYITSGNGKEMIWKVSGPSSVTEYQYDSFNRITQSKETLSQANKIFISKSSYDNFGRETQHTYPSGYAVNNTYNNLGYLTEIKDNSNQIIWQLLNMDALGRIREFDYGNGIKNKHNYSNLNYLYEIEHGSIHKQLYTHLSLTGNLFERNFKNFVTNTDLYERFTGYDNNDRLTQSLMYNPINNTVNNINNNTYDILGNLTSKTDAGNYSYTNPNKPFTLTQMTNVTNNISLNTLSLQHSDLDKVSQINEMATNKQMNFVYGNDENRIKMDYSIGGTNQYTRFYSENYDRQESTGSLKEWTYIYAPSGLCAVHYNNNGTKQLLYALTDHLGSPILLTNQNQTIVDQYSFDAWGRRRNPTDWTYNNLPANYTLIRGFTFHEHHDELGIINMNARVYDPVLGRFMQPDNYIQAPDHIQNYNRYAYCLNNPLKFNDPTGNIIAFSERDYKYWKSVSPLAIKVNLNRGSEVRKAGLEVSIGYTKNQGAYARLNLGVNYYFSDLDNSYKGWEGLYGAEAGIQLGSIRLEDAFMISDKEGNEFDQVTNKFTIGYGEVEFNYENDFMFGLPADGGDGLRTAAAKLSYRDVAVGFNLFTGDPGGAKGIFNTGSPRHSGLRSRKEEVVNGQLTYVNNTLGGDPDKYRSGVAYFEYKFFRIGRNNEKIRHAVQNKFAHSTLYPATTGEPALPHFAVLPDRKPKWYYNIGTGNGTSLW